MAVDLRQVARRSGVSVSTASRLLSGSSRVSAQTAIKVRAASTMVYVAGLIGDGFLVEIEAQAVVKR